MPVFSYRLNKPQVHWHNELGPEFPLTLPRYGSMPVSYTHLDVYKRQAKGWALWNINDFPLAALR